MPPGPGSDPAAVIIDARQLPPDADEFVAEVKWDGLRACVAVAGGRVRAWSRGGRDITAVYPELGALAAVAGRRALVLDGEIVALSGPRPDFTVLQRRMRASLPGAGLLAAVPVTLILFDVLRSGSEDLTGRPYVLRRALLEDLGLEVPGAAQVPPAFPGDAAALLEVTRAQGQEGIVLKRPASLYHPGLAHPVGLDYWITPGRAGGLGSSLGDHFGRLPACSLSAGLPDGAVPGPGVQGR